ncbi:hypothetical protein B0H15DRAFT_1003229 [Mycena belliarum]|uniref:Uncharacterized protein n=1 Tax=Mycena belliarum TaxID=1033014 RepID=A0AAD6XP20_9AGAR|nr:hypothetical protein B0H15DRAFT_1003229 [Mycena belliae]
MPAGLRLYDSARTSEIRFQEVHAISLHLPHPPLASSFNPGAGNIFCSRLQPFAYCILLKMGIFGLEPELNSSARRASAAVNVVRWSSSGELIASAGDDGMVITWAPSASPQASTYGRDLSAEDLRYEKEYWKPRTTFRCTMMQMYDLAWSPTAYRRVQMHARDRGLSQYVQGVAWDPLNEYIEQFSDRSMHVYRISTSKTCLCLRCSAVFRVRCSRLPSFTFHRVPVPLCPTYPTSFEPLQQERCAPVYDSTAAQDMPLILPLHRSPRTPTHALQARCHNRLPHPAPHPSYRRQRAQIVVQRVTLQWGALSSARPSPIAIGFEMGWFLNGRQSLLTRGSTICARAINFGPLSHTQASTDPSYPRTQQTRPAANATTSLPQSQHAGLLHRLARTHAEASPPTAVPKSRRAYTGTRACCRLAVPQRRHRTRGTDSASWALGPPHARQPLGTVFVAPRVTTHAACVLMPSLLRNYDGPMRVLKELELMDKVASSILDGALAGAALGPDAPKEDWGVIVELGVDDREDVALVDTSDRFPQGDGIREGAEETAQGPAPDLEDVVDVVDPGAEDASDNENSGKGRRSSVESQL